MTTLAAPDGRRPLFDDEHEDFRESFRRFVSDRLVPDYEDWDRAGIAPRELFQEAGRHGFVGMQIPESHGGSEVDDSASTPSSTRRSNGPGSVATASG